MSPARVTFAALVLLAMASGIASGADSIGAVRLSLEAGPSFDQSTDRHSSQSGYALGGGAEIGRVIGLTLGLGLEHYPFDRKPYIIQWSGPPGQTARVVGGGNKTVLAATVGVRAALPLGKVESFVELASGITSVVDHGPTYIDAVTGKVLARGGAYGWNGVLAEAGIGFRTRRESGCDWTLGFRSRGFSSLFEGPTDSSFQIRLGVVTP